MKKAVIFVIVLAIGYLLGSFFPFPMASSVMQGDIRGETELRVTVLTESEQPVTNLEVDLGEEPGQPPKGGSVETNQQGVATFFVKPGIYYVYFNMNNFPSDLQPLPEGSKRITVEEGVINEQTIWLQSNEIPQ